ncbi:MAG TPA: ABC transporter permease [Opitutaceae bacterium]|jgi:lipopolysaccharide transport system permease protein
MNRLTIEAGKPDRHYWRDLWVFRELFYFMTWRDLLVRYKQTTIGVAWSVIRPLLTMLVLTFAFGRVAKMSATIDYPYPLLVLTGQLPWLFFSNALFESGNSLVMNSKMISKVYFPRMVVPAATIITSIVDMAISACLLALLLVWYRFMPSGHVFVLPAFMLMAIATSLGVGLWTSALMVQYRDFRFIVPFVVQFGLYLSPVGYPTSRVPAAWRLLYSANPMVGVIDGFRWCIIGDHAGNEIYLPGMLLGVIMSAVLLWSGIRYFRKTERTFADVI